ncbi:MAG: bifunctional protein-serine/threonine kinase/phosphatase [Rhodocyclaceae bacterium]|nr:bifunctional protein-serine/threonine kinase/phosphatase [Rhodocyclaceae bacterium]MBX3666959.1 bifunctional protein-serine/threonine kinase/phosphatase [Rhodocyclaceae bacterium]
MPLTVLVGHSSQQGPRPRNEDFAGAVTPEGATLENKGLLAALADGVGGHANGREAAEYTVRGLLTDYYATPETWSIAQSVDTVMGALNRWLMTHARRTREAAGMATTLSALILRGRRWYCAHVGDSRIYLLRDGKLLRLTEDHVWEHPELNNVLRRAVGLDHHFVLDHTEGELEKGDRFLLVSDGVWATLDHNLMLSLLATGEDAEECAAKIALEAIKHGSNDNSSALVLIVNDVPAPKLRDTLEQLRRLPVPPRLKPQQELDGLVVEELLHESRVTLLYRVREKVSKRELVLKTLLPEVSDEDSTRALAHEEWLARRVSARNFPQVVQNSQRSHLYYLMTWHAGSSLKAWLNQGQVFTPTEAADLILRTLQGLAVLHRLGIVHRDIKPDNLHLDSKGQLRILDLGVAASDGLSLSEINNPGTPSYMAPELFEGQPCTEQTDLYAVGVTLYELLTRKYPYGEIEPFQRPKFGDPISPMRYRPDLPGWLEAVILKACARRPQDRFEAAEEFILALERGAARPLAVRRRSPLAERNPRLVLKVICVISIVLNLVLAFALYTR